jgi:hypothetical protein
MALAVLGLAVVGAVIYVTRRRHITTVSTSDVDDPIDAAGSHVHVATRSTAADRRNTPEPA